MHIYIAPLYDDVRYNYACIAHTNEVIIYIDTSQFLYLDR